MGDTKELDKKDITHKLIWWTIPCLLSSSLIYLLSFAILYSRFLYGLLFVTNLLLWIHAIIIKCLIFIFLTYLLISYFLAFFSFIFNLFTKFFIILLNIFCYYCIFFLLCLQFFNNNEYLYFYSQLYIDYFFSSSPWHLNLFLVT